MIKNPRHVNYNSTKNSPSDCTQNTYKLKYISISEAHCQRSWQLRCFCEGAWVSAVLTFQQNSGIILLSKSWIMPWFMKRWRQGSASEKIYIWESLKTRFFSEGGERCHIWKGVFVNEFFVMPQTAVYIAHRRFYFLYLRLRKQWGKGL